MESDVEQGTQGLRWRINPETLGLEPIEGKHPGTFTAQAFRAQEWPDCPVCGARIIVDDVDVRTAADRFPVFMMGAWRCPNDCDPRPVLRGGAR